ncbi:MAG: SLC13 family permease [Deltaproteobacteria bacterium]|nr:SLC13 family permease [Deltaproteobacteria bacterium]
MMDGAALFTALVVFAALVAMATERAEPSTALGMALAVLLLGGAVEANAALAGLANPAVVTVGLLFIVGAAVRRSGALARLTSAALGRRALPGLSIARLMLPVALLSAFLNNTPVVAMLLPEVRAWARRHGIAPSRLLLPLSYAAILGGLCTVIGTSTNLVVNGMLVQRGLRPVGFFEIGQLGLALVVGGILLIAAFCRTLLVDRPDTDAFADPRDFTTEVLVEAGGPLDGARLREIRLDAGRPLVPVEIDRDDHVLSAPRLDTVLRGGDRLVIAGAMATVLAATKAPGLRKADDSAFSEATLGQERRLLEVVVSERCPLVGARVGNGSFRATYGAAVLALARNGERVAAAREGGWILRAGDTLLVEAGSDFASRHRFHPHFHVVLGAEARAPAPRWQTFAAIGALLGMVGLAATGTLDMLSAAALAVIGLLAVGLVDRQVIRDSVDLRVLFAIAAAFGIGGAIEQTGLAATLAHALTAVGNSPFGALAAVYLATAVLTELMTNNAAAVMMLPIGLAAASEQGASPMPFAIVVMVAASASFATPMGYQTNLMVYGPGGYHFTDFLRAGVPMGLLVAALTLWLVPTLWPF